MSEADTSSDNKRGKLISLCPTLSNTDFYQIWNVVSSYIHKCLIGQKGITIHNLGVFSFEQSKLDVGGNKYLLIQRPIFQLSEKFCQTHGLKQTKHTINGAIPVPPLNLSALTQDCNYDRDTIDTAVKEMISLLNRSVAGQQTVEFTFHQVGRLHVRSGVAKFKFYKDLVQSLENGGKIFETMQNRPGTADSVMSDRPASRAYSVSLPYNGAHPSSAVKTKMETIPEDDIFQEFHQQQISNGEALTEEGGEYSGVKDTSRSSQSSRASSRLPNRIPVPVSMVSDFEFSDPAAASATSVGNRTSSANPLQEVHHHHYHQHQHHNQQIAEEDKQVQFNSPTPTTNGHEYEVKSINGHDSPEQTTTERSDAVDLSARHPLNNRLLFSRSKSTLSPLISANDRPISRGSSCGHPASVGQELCYLCHQRSRRNIPISFVEEIRQRDAEEDDLILTYQQLKDSEYIMKEQERLLSKRHDAQKMSAFNLGVGEAVKQKNQYRDPNFYPSYIMKQRPITPPRFIKQNQLKTDLTAQIDVKKGVHHREKSDKALLEKLEQIQLAEDLALQRQRFLDDKLKRQKEYNEALEVQVRNKPEQIPDRAPDSGDIVFGKNDISEEKLLERRRKAQELLREQENEVMRKKREEILQKIQNQKYEEEVLKKSKMDLLRDRANRYQRLTEDRLDLENEWSRAAQEKREKDLLERVRASTPGNLLHEQCDKYKRCSQCRRKLNNVGESNIWCESYYIPGSRYIC